MEKSGPALKWSLLEYTTLNNMNLPTMSLLSFGPQWAHLPWLEWKIFLIIDVKKKFGKLFIQKKLCEKKMLLDISVINTYWNLFWGRNLNMW